MSISYDLAKQLSGFKPFVALKEANGRWLGSAAGYHSIHQWLTRNYGNPKSCEHCGKRGMRSPKGRWNIHWALIHGLEHHHEISHYIGLCYSCHKSYDNTEVERERLRHMAQHQTSAQLAKLSVKRREIALRRPRNEYGRYIAKAA